MDWLNRARQFVGNLFGGAQRTIGQISGNVARGVGRAEQQAARTAQQVVRQISQPPRIQLPQIPQLQMPRFQAPRVQLPQAPKIDLAAVGKALSDYYGKTALSQTTPQNAQKAISQINLNNIGKTLKEQGIGMLRQATGNVFIPSAGEINPENIMKYGTEKDKQALQKYLQTGKAGDVAIAPQVTRQGQTIYAPKGLSTAQQIANPLLAGLFWAGAKGPNVASSAAGKLAEGAASMGVSNVATGAVSRYGETGKLSEAFQPKALAIDLGTGLVTGALFQAPGAIKAYKGQKALSAIGGQIKLQNLAKFVDKNAPITVRTLPEKGALRAQGYTNVKVQFQPKPGQVAPTMQGAIPQIAPKAPKGQEALFAEARKYKSANEFVKSQGKPIYHGTPKKLTLSELNPNKTGENTTSIKNIYDKAKGIYFTDSFDEAKLYSTFKKDIKGLDVENPTIIPAYIDESNIKVINSNNILYKNDVKKFIEEGYSGIKKIGVGKTAGNTEWIIFDKDILKSKSQLNDIWNQANKQGPSAIYENVPKSYLQPKGESSLADIQISTKPPKPAQPISNKVLEVKAQFLNRFDPIERFVRNVELERGSKLKPSQNPMYYVKQFMGGGGIANYRIDNELTPMLKQTKNFDGLRQYLVARRMNELAGRGIGKKANTAIAELTQKYGPDEIANFDKISTQLYAYQKNQLDQLLATGVISKQSYNNIIAKNQFYIPFNRVIPDVIADTTQSGQKISGAKKLASLKAIKGSEKEIIDPIESIIKNTYDVQATVAKQKVLNSLVALAPDEFKPLPKGAGLKAPAIELFQDGKRIKLGADPELAKALNAMDEEQLNLVVRALSLPARALRAGATSLNVAFALPNVLRDQLSAAVNNKYGGIPIYDFISGLSSVMKKDDSYKKWILSGADQATLFAQDRTTLQRGVKDITGGLGYKAGKLVKSPLELFRIFGDLSEKGSRVGVFKRALKGAKKEGLNTEDALLTAMRESREATIDFAQRGSKMKAFNAMVPFLNARVQGTYKLAQSFKNRPIQTMMRGAGIVSVPSVILYIHNNAQGNAEVYKEIPEYIKRENFIIVTGDKNTPFIKIPKGEVGKIFANPVESFMAQINNDSTNWTETAKSLADAFLPVGSVSEPTRFITDIGPTAVTVPYQMLSNYDVFRGRNIVGQYQKDLPAAQQYSKYNTETAKKIGELLNISPAQLEFALSGFTGGLGRQGLQVADIAQGQRPPIQELPVLSRFLGEEKDLSASAQEIYKQAEKAKQEKARENYAIKQALQKGDTSVLENVDKATATRLKRSVAEDQAKKDLTPIQKALFDLPQAQFDALKATGKNASDIAVVENIKNQIDSSLKKATTPKIKVPSTKVVKGKIKKGRVAKQKRVSLKTPRLRRITVSVPKGRKVSFKQPTPTKARKSIKIKTG